MYMLMTCIMIPFCQFSFFVSVFLRNIIFFFFLYLYSRLNSEWSQASIYIHSRVFFLFQYQLTWQWEAVVCVCVIEMKNFIKEKPLASQMVEISFAGIVLSVKKENEILIHFIIFVFSSCGLYTKAVLRLKNVIEKKRVRKVQCGWNLDGNKTVTFSSF